MTVAQFYRSRAVNGRAVVVTGYRTEDPESWIIRLRVDGHTSYWMCYRGLDELTDDDAGNLIVEGGVVRIPADAKIMPSPNARKRILQIHQRKALRAAA